MKRHHSACTSLWRTHESMLVRRFSLLFCVCLLLFAWPQSSFAQPAEATPISFDTDVDGQLDNLTLSSAYSFTGKRGEFVSIELRTTTGNLDPLLTLLDSAGTVLQTLDDGIGRGVRIESIRIPANGTYYINVSRFGGATGVTRGGFTLRLSRVGVSSESGSTLRYNDTIINTISDAEPALYYTFQANQGDILDVDMQRVSGDLDPLLKVVDSNATVLAASDDVPGSFTLDAAIEGLVIEQTGTYVIVATRYGEEVGRSTGAFVLSLAENDDSGLGNTLQTAAPLEPGTVLENELTPTRFEQYYTFIASEDDLVRVRMDRVSGSLDAYLILLDADLQELTFDDDSGSGQNALIREFRIPASGLYYVKATRFGGTEADTVGRYRIQADILRGAFDNITEDSLPILYGSTVTGVIDDNASSVLYAFFGNQGDVISVSMNRGDGNLDPFISLLDGEQQLLLNDDDSGSAQNARIEQFVLPETGVYYVRATRYTGNDGDSDTRGSYILVLAQVSD
ncbi:MAG: PPC domain-containing protein [Chloroflexota bacterium]